MPFDAIETPKKIEMPPRPAEFTVGDGLQADLFLLLDDAFDLAIFDRLEISRRHLAFGPSRARLFQRSRPQQAADMIGAKGWTGALHGRRFLVLLIPPLKEEGRIAKRSGVGSCQTR